MPHKQNPVNASVVLAAAVRAPTTMLEGLVINPSRRSLMRLRRIRP
jgi:adenylosuccinate lyase